MSDKKLFTAREAAQAVLNKAKEILKESTLAKAEYKTENDPKPGVKYGKIEKDVKPIERDWNEYEVKPGSSKDSTGPRLKEQTSPSTNPKEEAEGNNKPGGMEPEYEFKDKVAKELAKEKASHMVKSQSGMHTVMYKTAAIEKSEPENDLKKAEESKHDRCVKDVERNSPEVKNPHAVCVAEGVKPAKWKKSENPDREADAELGEKVEHDVEEHFKENAEAEAQEGHDLMAKPDSKMEKPTESAIIPALVGSAKLAKFMERKHSKRKAAQGAQSQAPAAVGKEMPGAPAPASSQAGQPDNSRPKTQPTKGDEDKV